MAKISLWDIWRAVWTGVSPFEFSSWSNESILLSFRRMRSAALRLCMTARWNALQLILSFANASAPASSRVCTASTLPKIMALWSRVLPSLLTAFSGAPSSIRHLLRQAPWIECAAQCKGVLPSTVRKWSIPGPCLSTIALTISSLPWKQARWTAGSWSPFSSTGEAPNLRSTLTTSRWPASTAAFSGELFSSSKNPRMLFSGYPCSTALVIISSRTLWDPQRAA